MTGLSFVDSSTSFRTSSASLLAERVYRILFCAMKRSPSTGISSITASSQPNWIFLKRLHIAMNLILNDQK